jgi:hypothetical protein
VPLWPWLASTALALAVADVGLRRLRLERADLARLRGWARQRGERWRRPPGPGTPAPRDAATDALFEAKARARRRE